MEGDFIFQYLRQYKLFASVLESEKSVYRVELRWHILGEGAVTLSGGLQCAGAALSGSFGLGRHTACARSQELKSHEPPGRVQARTQICSGIMMTALLPAVLLLPLLCFSCLLVELSAEHGLWMHINRRRLVCCPVPGKGSRNVYTYKPWWLPCDSGSRVRRCLKASKLWAHLSHEPSDQGNFYYSVFLSLVIHYYASVLGCNSSRIRIEWLRSTWLITFSFNYKYWSELLSQPLEGRNCLPGQQQSTVYP